MFILQKDRGFVMPRPTFRKKPGNNNGGISKFSSEKITVGNIRKTQMITTFGVGSIVDFKNDTVIIASTDDWDQNLSNIEEVEGRNCSTKISRS